MGKRTKRKNGRKRPAGEAELRGQAESAITRGSSKRALDIAKEVAKRWPGADADELLFRAYVARVEALGEKGSVTSVLELAAHVEKRFPDRAQEVRAHTLRISVGAGRLSELLRELSAPDLHEGRRRELTDLLAREIRDPAEIVEAGILPEDHPLLGEAAIAARMLERAVTQGVEPDDPDLISGLSRRSPFAPFSRLARAIAAAYAGDSASTERLLSGIPVDSRATTLAPVVRAIATGVARPDLSPIKRRLFDLTVSAHREITEGLRAVASAFGEDQIHDGVRLAREVIPRVARDAPHLRGELGRLLATEWVRADMDPCDFGLAYGVGVGREEELHRWFALAYEAEKYGRDAIRSWSDYLRARGASADRCERALVLLRQATLACEIRVFEAPERLADLLGVADLSDDSGEEEMMAAIERILREIGEGPDPAELFEESLSLHPTAEAWRSYLAWLSRMEPGRAEDVARRWHEADPATLDPVLCMVNRAEEEGEIDEALAWLARAEAISPAHPEVKGRAFRLRLWRVAETLRQGRDDGARRDLDSLLSFGPDPVVAPVLRGLRWFAAENRSERARILAEIVASEGDGGAPLLLHLLAATLDVKRLAMVLPRLGRGTGAELFRLVARYRRALDAAGVPMRTVAEIGRRLRVALEDGGAPEPSELVPIGETLAEWQEYRALYLLAGHGIARSGPDRCRFLLLRGLALGERRRRHRRRRCLVASRDLARRSGDEETARRAVAELEKEGSLRKRAEAPLDPVAIQKIIDTELLQRKPLPKRRRTQKTPELVA
jgi:tetratricopeptide (TPR) repeat protein